MPKKVRRNKRLTRKRLSRRRTTRRQRGGDFNASQYPGATVVKPTISDTRSLGDPDALNTLQSA